MTVLTRPTITFRLRLASAGIELSRSQMPQEGRVMWWQRSKLLLAEDLAAAKARNQFPSGATRLDLSVSDYDREAR